MTALDVVRSISGLTSAIAERYPATNAFVLGRMDKLMPACTGIAIVGGVLLAVALDQGPVQALFAAGATLLTGVIAVSVGVLGPINAAVRAIDPNDPRPDWPALRERWRRWHFVRVGLGQAGAMCSREELLGVGGVERSEGDGGNWGGRPRPGDCASSLERDVL